MTSYASWEPAAERLHRRTGPPTAEQIEVATKLGVDLAADLPTQVYAAKLRTALDSALLLRTYPPPTEQQLEYVRSLSAELGLPLVGDIQNASHIAAWINTFYDLRALRALRAQKFAEGDIVEIGRPKRTAEISSVGEDGQLFLRGGRGQRARPHRATIISRASDLDSGPGSARYEAKQEVARFEPVRTEVSEDRLRDILDWEVVDTRPSELDLRALEDVLDEAGDEKPLQTLLAERPQLLASVIGGHWKIFVAPQPSLAGRFIPDFVIGGLNSMGLHWTLVELESPTERVTLQSGRLAGKLREAEGQIRDWRNWLDGNVGTARMPRSLGGVGLAEIRTKPVSLVIIGRSDPTLASRDVRIPMLEEQQILVHSYDWLIERARDAHRGAQGYIDRRLLGYTD